MDLEDLVFPVSRRMFGPGWIYRLPWFYQRVITDRFGSVRTRAYQHLFERLDGLQGVNTCLDVACGTGIASVWMASELSKLEVVGIDSSLGMLNHARHRARQSGVANRCRFLQANATTLCPSDLPVPKFDFVNCSLGYSVIPDWKAAFHATLRLLDDDGVYVIFDQFDDELRVPDFASDQTRKSWELIEDSFVHSETEWFGDSFISFGKGRKARVMNEGA